MLLEAVHLELLKNWRAFEHLGLQLSTKRNSVGLLLISVIFSFCGQCVVGLCYPSILSIHVQGAYSDSAGVEVVRKHVAAYISQRDGVKAHYEDVLLSTGASESVRVSGQFLTLFLLASCIGCDTTSKNLLASIFSQMAEGLPSKLLVRWDV